MDALSRTALLAQCKERGLKGYARKKKAELLDLLNASTVLPTTQTHTSPVTSPTSHENVASRTEFGDAQIPRSAWDVASRTEFGDAQIPRSAWDVRCGDSLKILPTLEDNSAQIILADPPYNIGKDFGNASDKQPMDAYLEWTDAWIRECLRILKPNGTMFVFGFSEILALILARIPYTVQRRWLVWHYTNKNVASLHFWQRSHESILVLWKDTKVFHRDAVREAYTEEFLKGAAGKERTATKGRFSKGDKTTTYTAHPAGALPRDVIKVPALAGGAGMKERVNHPTQKPLALCEKLLRSCQQGPTEGYVLVPFAGSGSECVAAKKLGLPFVGIELNEAYVEILQERLAATPTTPTTPITTE